MQHKLKETKRNEWIERQFVWNTKKKKRKRSRIR